MKIDNKWIFMAIVLSCIAMGCQSLSAAEKEEAMTDDPMNDDEMAAPITTEQETAVSRVMVKFKPEITPEDRAAIIARHGLRSVSYIESISLEILEIPVDVTQDQVINDLMQDELDSIEYAEADATVSIPEPITPVEGEGMIDIEQ